jgi:pimeloyl-ACP methyl ester carboxylesterase
MATLETPDGVKLYYEETGEGQPVIFVHEFAGDYRSYEPQVRYFSRRYRCITFNARGYPPSDVPEDVSRYSQDLARDDLLAVLNALDIERAHIVGISMGAFASLHFGLNYPERAHSLVLGGCGYGAAPENRSRFQVEARAMGESIAAEGMATIAEDYALTAARVQLQNKDPRGWAEFKTMLADHSSHGSANTMLGVQAERVSLYTLAEELAALSVPTLVITGDEDEPCLQESLFLKRQIPSSGLCVLAKTGHALNLEEPAQFNQQVDEFLHQVEAGRWSNRDPRSLGNSIISRQP